MLQRIQTVYLLIVSALTALLFFFPYAQSSQVNPETASSFEIYFSYTLLVVSLAFSFGSIFLYKNRPLQLRLNYTNIVLFIALYAVAAYYVFSTERVEYTELAQTFNFWVISIPLINVVLTWMAIFYIKKDEKLVSSLNRLR